MALIEPVVLANALFMRSEPAKSTRFMRLVTSWKSAPLPFALLAAVVDIDVGVADVAVGFVLCSSIWVNVIWNTLKSFGYNIKSYI